MKIAVTDVHVKSWPYNKVSFQYYFRMIYEPGWKKDAKGWWYRRADGTYPKKRWEKIDGKMYTFDASGYMK